MNNFNYIAKQAGPVTTAAAVGVGAKLAGGALDFIKGAGKKTIDIGVDVGKTIAAKAIPVAFFTTIMAGLGAGYGLARLTNPKAGAKNSDKLLESEALATEIAVTEKKLKALEARRKEKQLKGTTEQRYDRFV